MSGWGTMAAMRFLPRRHWFRFRLSTWFVLLGILCWVMALRPSLSFEHARRSNVYVFALGMVFDSGPRQDFLLVASIGPLSLLWPALALLVFLTSKAFWAIRSRRARPAVVSVE